MVSYDLTMIVLPVVIYIGVAKNHDLGLSWILIFLGLTICYCQEFLDFIELGQMKIFLGSIALMMITTGLFTSSRCLGQKI